MIIEARFVASAFQPDQLPEEKYREIAFAGRSNVGKSSLINRLVQRKNLVKVSSKPGKTQSINFFLVNDAFYLVDLPGYGYAQAPQQIRRQWRGLITGYLESRAALKCVVIILDLRHELKAQDLDLYNWLKDRDIPTLPVYTKIDKLSRNEQHKLAAGLDSSLNITPAARVLFSAKTGEGREKLLTVLDKFYLRGLLTSSESDLRQEII